MRISRLYDIALALGTTARQERSKLTQMPSGKTHDKIAWLLMPLVATGGAIATSEPRDAFACWLGYMWASFWMGPDLDTRSLQYKRWGVLRFLWLPYRWLGGHRSFASQSHDALFGPVVRFGYLAAMLALMAIPCLWWLGIGYGRVSEALANYPIWQFFLGTWIGSVVHHLADWAAAVVKLKRGRG